MDRRHTQGYSLLEVMLTVFVFSVGLLGVAGMQVKSMRNTHDAYLRTIATQQAIDMADRMRANLAGVTAGAYDNITGTPANPGCRAAPCTAAQMAQHDASIWNSANAALLPAGTGTVTGPDASGLYAVTLSWGARSGETATFTLSLRP